MYTVLATAHDQIKAGIDFARTYNLRLIIRNTGHDFLGRSTGWGALTINTHSFQNTTFMDSYDGPADYAGPTVRIGAGVQARALLTEAHARSPPLAVVVGECPVSHPIWGNYR